jgi:hypothetical protein
VPDVHRTGLTMMLGRHQIRAHAHQTEIAIPADTPPPTVSTAAALAASSLHQFIDSLVWVQVELPTERALDPVRQRQPFLARCRRETPERAERSVAGIVRRPDGLYEEMVDILLAVLTVDGFDVRLHRGSVNEKPHDIHT